MNVKRIPKNHAKKIQTIAARVINCFSYYTEQGQLFSAQFKPLSYITMINDALHYGDYLIVNYDNCTAKLRTDTDNFVIMTLTSTEGL